MGRLALVIRRRHGADLDPDVPRGIVMKKRMSILLSMAVLALAVMAVPAVAAPGGAPAAHGLSGADFGKAVSGLAQSAPGAVADHVSGR
jgi:hypothetical protein